MRRLGVPVAVALVVLVAVAWASVGGIRGALAPTDPVPAAAPTVTEGPPPALPPTSGSPTGAATPVRGATQTPVDDREVIPETASPAPTPPRTWQSARPAAGIPAPTVTAGPPTLHVPSLGIVARLTASEVVQGEYAVPRDPALVGVHRSGARGVEARLRPGPGVLLMSGHVAVGDTRGALWALHALAPGDPLVVTGPTGTRRWHAEKLEVFRADQLPQDLLRGSGPERLVLVTCSGPVVLADGRRAYRDNLVVTAVPA